MSQARLCATVTAETTAGLRAARDAAGGADLVELRLDGVRDLDVDGALSGRAGPVLVTCRPVGEGGRFSGSEEERRRILLRAFKLGADWVDLEWSGGFEPLIAERRGPQRRAVDARLRGHAGRPGIAVPRDAGHRGRGRQDRRLQPFGRRRGATAPARTRHGRRVGGAGGDGPDRRADPPAAGALRLGLDLRRRGGSRPVRCPWPT